MAALVERDDNQGTFVKFDLATLNNPRIAAEAIQRKFNLSDAPSHLYDEGNAITILTKLL